MPDPAEIGELIRALTGEIREAAADAEAITRGSSIRLENLRVRVASTTEGVPPVTIELALGARTGLRQRIDAGPWEEVAVPGAPRLPSALAELPVSALKEMRRVHEVRFRSVGVETIGELAALTDETVLELLHASGSHLPLEYRTRARLLAGAPIEIPDNAAPDRSLHSLFGSSPAELQQLTGSRISTATGQRAGAQISLAGVVLDEEAMRSLTLADLAPAKAP